MSLAPSGFAARVVSWQRTHGRNSLPWQNTRDPYRVWLSEVMLQQTQVATVLGYFERFVLRFPDVQSLAAASLDEVLALWSGLGYYSRARNLHRCAQDVVQHHGAVFPRDSRTLQTLPGIGRSTAAAIASFCHAERVAIMDANARRVLARLLAFGGDLSSASQARDLWDHATALLPGLDSQEDMPLYTQGLMDLGAGICVPRNPQCLLCPVSDLCLARGRAPENYPVRARKPKRTDQSLWLLHARSENDAVWLEKRPVPGVWAGLYCLPVFDSRPSLTSALPVAYRSRLLEGRPFTHALTHKDLHLNPVEVRLRGTALKRRDGAWFRPQQLPQIALPSPIRRLLSQV